MANEPAVTRSRVPRGYSLVPKGNVYVTGNCRKQTQAADRTVFLVVNTKEKQIGIAVPTEIYEDVKQKEAETRATRAANVDRRDNSIKNEFKKVILTEFPSLPLEDLPKILEKALKKRAGKVGRTGQLSERRKAKLAVRAHIRHCHTQYDNLLRGADKKGVKAKNLARKTVQSQVDEVAARWAQGRSGQPSRPTKVTAMATSSTSPRPTRSTRIGGSEGTPKSARAKPARIIQSSTTLTTTSATDPPTGPDAAPSSSRRPFSLRKRASHEVIDLTGDDDDSYDDDDDDLPDLMTFPVTQVLRHR